MAGVMIFFRTGTMISLVPLFGERVIPVRVKLSIALCFTIILIPMVDIPLIPISFSTFIQLIFGEVCNGLFWGIMLRLFVLGLETAGSIAAQSLSLSQLFGGASADPLPAFGRIWVWGGLAFATILGLHTHLATYILGTYNLIPLGELISTEMVATEGIAQVADSFLMAFTLAAPMMVASVLYNLTLGFINRAMPQLMVSFVGAPAITAGGLILMLLTTPLVLSIWFEQMMIFLDSIQ